MSTPAGRIVKALSTPRPLVWPAKDAGETLDYTIDWADRLGCDSITSATFTLATAAGLTIDDSEHDSDRLATVWLSGGTEGSKAKILCEIETSDGRAMQETVALLLRAR